MSRISSRQERITPAKAERYLAKNVHNRTLRAATVHRLAAAIRRGEWTNNGETIKFNGDGKLIDGQHRLAAIIEADQAVDALVVSGLTQVAQETVDTGVRRNPADVLGLRGFLHGVEVAAACKAAHFQAQGGRMVSGQMSGDYPTHQQIVRLAESDRATLSRIAEWAVGYQKANVELGLSPPMLAELAYAFSLKTSLDTALAFFGAVATNQPGPASTFRRSMVEDRIKRGRMSRNMRLAFAVKAFNGWTQERPVKRLRWKRRGPNREPFPMIEEG